MKWSSQAPAAVQSAAPPRSLVRRAIAFKTATIGDDGTFEGYGSVFDVIDGGGDIVIPGAFAKSLASRRPSLLWQHDANLPVGVWDEIDEDARGLKCRGRIGTDFDLGRQALWLVRNGGLDGLSIGFDIEDHEIDRKRNARLLKSLGLWEISLVTWPMNEESRVVRGGSLVVRGDSPAGSRPPRTSLRRGAGSPRPTAPSPTTTADLVALTRQLRAV